jgi:iron complex transport system ATP-binding protein
MKMAIPLLELRDVSYIIKGKSIINQLSWIIEEKQNWVILGPNGAGKTTLLKIIYGSIWPNGGGDVFRLGKSDIDLGNLRKHIGWVTSTIGTDIPAGEPVINTVLSGKYAQLGLWMLPGETVSDGDFEHAMTHLTHMGCEALADRLFGTLSQGEQQKVLICRALMADPFLLILDEPCGGLDPGSRELFLSSLQTLGTKDTCPNLIFVTHHPEEIMPLFTHTIIIDKGNSIAKGRTDEILTSDMVNTVYGISVELLKKNGRYWAVPV